VSGWRFVKACPAYFGAKSSCLGDIFAAVASALPRERWSGATWVEPFLGGGSVALAAKRQGFRVITNDLADRAVIVGRALVANDRVRLTPADVLRLHAPIENDGRIEREFAPAFFLPEHARWFDNAFAQARAVPDETRRSLLLLMLMHAILAIRPFGDFSRTEVTEAFARGEYDRVSLSPRGVRRVLETPAARLVDGLADRINAGVFSNGHRHEIHQRDALEFVAAVAHGADVLYADPPYWGSNSYEQTYRGLDQILENRDTPRETSGFNEAGALELFDALLDAARPIPVWVLSFGGGRITHEEFLERIRRHRPAVLAPVKLRYRVGTAGKDSGKQREILVVARAGGLS
jgi:adenine-specific DNA methylase